MKQFKYKLSVVFLPYLLTGFVFIVIYSLFNYFNQYHFHWLNLKPEVANMWYPILFGIATYYLLKPQYDLLVYDKLEKWEVLFILLNIGGVACPIISVQSYLSTQGNLMMGNNGALFIAYNHDFYLILLTNGISILANFLLILPASFDYEGYFEYRDKTFKQKVAQIFGELGILKPEGRQFVSIILIDISIILFILSTSANFFGFKDVDNHSLLFWGANYQPLTLRGQWWRMITNLFIHRDMYHLFVDLGILLFLGPYLEDALGRLKYLIVFFVCGLAGSVVNLIACGNHISYGGTSATLGLIGFFMALLLNGKVIYDLNSTQNAKANIKGILILLVLLFALSYYFDYYTAGYFAGLVVGFILGWFIGIGSKYIHWEEDDDY